MRAKHKMLKTMKNRSKNCRDR